MGRSVKACADGTNWEAPSSYLTKVAPTSGSPYDHRPCRPDIPPDFLPASTGNSTGHEIPMHAGEVRRRDRMKSTQPDGASRFHTTRAPQVVAHKSFPAPDILFLSGWESSFSLPPTFPLFGVQFSSFLLGGFWTPMDTDPPRLTLRPLVVVDTEVHKFGRCCHTPLLKLFWEYPPPAREHDHVAHPMHPSAG